MSINLRLAAVALAGMITVAPATPKHDLYDHLMQAFDRERPGFGIETTRKGPIDLPMAYGLVAKAAAIAKDRELATTAADWLISNRTTSQGVGWGLGWEWDAFADGSTNSADTVYGITTALAVDGLLDVYDLTGDERYISTVVEALDYYSDKRSKTNGGHFFWYSDQVEDARNVHNVSAMLTGVYAKASRVADRSDYRDLARSALGELMSSAQWSGERLTWVYADIERRRPNDAVHAAYIAYGASLASEELGLDTAPKDALASYLREFLSEDGKPMEFRKEEAGENDSLRARSWGVGMLGYAFFYLGDASSADRVLESVGEYEYASGQYSYRYGDKVNALRGTAHLLLAAAAAHGQPSSRP